MPEIDDVNYEKVFLGACFGIGLKTRDSTSKDKHLLFDILIEDDENWFRSKNDGCGASTAWLTDLQQVLEEAKLWLEKNAKPDRHGRQQYGWKLR